MLDREVGVKYAELLLRSYWCAKKTSEHLMRISISQLRGGTFYEEYKAHIKRADERILPILQQYDISLVEYFGNLGQHLYFSNLDPKRDRASVRNYLKDERWIKTLVSKILSKRELDKNYRSIMVSIVKSIDYICLLTASKAPNHLPSQLLAYIISEQQLLRYIGSGKLCLHFLAMIPGLDQTMSKNAVYYLDPNDPRKSIMDPVYKTFLATHAILKQEAFAACAAHNFSRASFVKTLDGHYLKHKADFLSKCQNL